MHWRRIVQAAHWQNVAEVQAAFSKAKALNGERVRFEVAGGDFRLIAAFDFRRSIAFVKFVGTHAEYNKIDADRKSVLKVEIMNVRPIRNDSDHEATLREIEQLWSADEGTDDGDLLDVLVTLAEAYEERRWPVDEISPVEAIEAAMAYEGHSRADLGRLIGPSRATEILQRKRALTLPMIRKIASAWHVPERVLVRHYPIQPKGRASQSNV